MKKSALDLVALSALGLLDINRLAVNLPYTPVRPPEPDKYQQERREAAEAKRARKLARYTDTPAARAQRAQSEAAALLPPWTPLPVPTSVDADEQEHPAGGV